MHTQNTHKKLWVISVEVEQETNAPPPKKYPGSAPRMGVDGKTMSNVWFFLVLLKPLLLAAFVLRCGYCEVCFQSFVRHLVFALVRNTKKLLER